MARRGKRTVAAELRVDSSRLRGDLRRAEREVNQSSRRMSQKMRSAAMYGGRGASAGGGTSRSRRLGGGMIGGGMRAGAALGAGYLAFRQIKSAIQYKKSLVDLAVNADMTQRQMNALDRRIIKVSNTYGVAKEQVRDYVAKVVEQTGSISLARSTMEDMTKVAYATGASMQAIGQVTVDVSQKTGMGLKEMARAWGIMASQAKAGSVEIRDLARVLPKVLGYMAKFGHRGEGALRSYAALLQMTRRTAPSAEEASTQAARLLGGLGRDPGKIEKDLGIKLTDKKGALLGLETALPRLGQALYEAQQAGGVAKRDKYGRVIKKGGKIQRESVTAYTQRKFGERGGLGVTAFMDEAGRRARGEQSGSKYQTYAQLVNASASGIEEMTKRRKEAAPALHKMTLAINKFKNDLYETILPALASLLPPLSELAMKVLPTAVSAMRYLIENWKSAAAIFLAFKLQAYARGFGGGGGGGLLAGAVAGGGYGGVGRARGSGAVGMPVPPGVGGAWGGGDRQGWSSMAARPKKRGFFTRQRSISLGRTGQRFGRAASALGSVTGALAKNAGLIGAGFGALKGLWDFASAPGKKMVEDERRWKKQDQARLKREKKGLQELEKRKGAADHFTKTVAGIKATTAAGAFGREGKLSDEQLQQRLKDLAPAQKKYAELRREGRAMGVTDRQIQATFYKLHGLNQAFQGLTNETERRRRSEEQLTAATYLFNKGLKAALQGMGITPVAKGANANKGRQNTSRSK